MTLFENAIKTEATKRTCKIHLNRFQKFCKVDQPSNILKFSDQELQEKLEDFLFDLKENVSPNSIAGIFAAVELFISLKDRILHFKKIKRCFLSGSKKLA